MASVLITYDLPKSVESTSASGILLPNGLILIHGSILSSLIQKAFDNEINWWKDFRQSLTSDLTPSAYLNSLTTFYLVEKTGAKVPLTIFGSWCCPLVSSTFRTLFDEWSIGTEDEFKSTYKDFISVFIMLYLKNATPNLTTVIPLSTSVRGEAAVVESTPFGNAALHNSISRGIVSNVFGEKECIFLSDVVTFLGSEGAAVYNRDNQLMGIVLCSLNYWRGEHTGWTICGNLLPILARLKSIKVKILNGDLELLQEKSNSPNSAIDENIVRIRCGPTWGSGVITDISPTLVLTCSHVLSSYKNLEVKVIHKGVPYRGEIVYKTPDNKIFDIAVVKILNGDFVTTGMELLNRPLQKGEIVLAAGFPAFSEYEIPHVSPSVTQGCISRVGSSILQTTCSILSGASGGAIISDNKLVGIITCNTRRSQDEIYPKLNFAIPVSVVKKPLLDFILLKDDSALKTLETNDIHVIREWCLQPSKL